MAGVIEYITDFAARNESFRASDLLEEAQSIYPMSRAVLNAYLAKLVEQGKLERTGRGVYGSIAKKNHFTPKTGEKASGLYHLIKQEFPLISMCVYEGQWISPLMHHLANNQAIYLEVEKDVSEAVFHKLQDRGLTTFHRPDKTEMYKYVDLGNAPIIVKNLVTEAPLQTIGEVQIPTLEKLLVDMYCDPDFFYLHGSEYWHIMHNAHRYSINTSKMLRYAARRSAAEEIKKIWEESVNDFD